MKVDLAMNGPCPSDGASTKKLLEALIRILRASSITLPSLASDPTPAKHHDAAKLGDIAQFNDLCLSGIRGAAFGVQRHRVTSGRGW